MSRLKSPRNTIEALEARIAPAAAATVYPTIAEAEQYDLTHPTSPHKVIGVTNGTPILLTAGEVLTTGAGAESGSYLLFVQQGEALVFFSDLNNNGIVDSNEITGIAAGDGLRLISFVDIHGDIVTDLNANGTLSDSQQNASASNPALGGDGRVLLNNSIDLIEFRSLTQADLSPGENVNLRLAPTNYSLYGNIYAGKSFGTPDGGLVIDTSGAASVFAEFNGIGADYYPNTTAHPVVGSIETGTAAGGLFFNFGPSRGGALNPGGQLASFTPPPGQPGGDIMNVGASNSTTQFSLGQIISGNGGIGARGGNIVNVTLNGDTTGYNIIAGDGGSGPIGGAGGAIVNFSDLGSIVGAVEVHSGNGGVGTTGIGGAGGSITFGTFNVSGGVDIKLGNGGNGFSAGGAGASLPSGTITVPVTTVPPNATVVVSTMHAIGQDGVIGTTTPIDFDGDGFGDLVYATQNPSQLIVVLGDGQTYSLPIPYGTVDAITVGDLLGNGHLDIAVGSNDNTQDAGIVVYQSKFTNTGVFDGFTAPEVSQLPSLFSTGGYLRSNVPVTGIVAGDFAGDGRTGLAVSATYYLLEPAPTPHQVVVFLKPDLQNGVPDGLFYADFGQVATATTPATPHIPFFDISDGGTATYIEATALSTSATHDVVVAVPANSLAAVATIGKGVNNVVDILDNSNPNAIGPAYTAISTGQVDTNRTLNTPGQTDHQTLTKAIAGPFTVLDFNGDGNADFAVLTQAPAGYMVSIEGDGNVPGGKITSGTGDNAGTSFGANTPDGYQIGTAQVGIHTLLDPATGKLDEVAVLDYDQGTFKAIFGVVELQVLDPTNAAYTLANPGSIRLGTVLSNFNTNTPPDAAIVAWDVFTPVLPPLGGANPPRSFAVGIPDINPIDFQDIDVVGAGGGELIPEATNFIDITAGNGGNGLVGGGGNGGSLGGVLQVSHIKVTTVTTTTVPGTGTTAPTTTTTTTTATVTQVVGQLDIVLPPDEVFGGTVTLTAGDGGSGFTSGGTGGNISGTSVAYAADIAAGVTSAPGSPPVTQSDPTVGDVTLENPVFLFGGNGGAGVSGSGGSGGSLVQNSIDRGELFVAGNGGVGAFGGNGGNVLGNGLSGYYDTFDLLVQITAGAGASGVKSGGNGGSVTNFHPQFDLQFLNDVGGQYEITAGNGGSAISGGGGNGGSVTSDSPFSGPNFMAGDVVLEGGSGGDGLSGGNGGGVSNFLFQPGKSDNPSVLAIIGGEGGHGITGPGGKGGSLTNISTPSQGQPLSLNNFLRGQFSQGTNYDYDRVIAGDGGSSSGGVGGAGGSVVGVNPTSEFTYFAMVAGAGGTGLSAGGAGGSVVNSSIQFGGTSSSKALVIAGAGGDATAWVADPFNTTTPDQGLKAFGGVVGHGGDGGSIENFVQGGFGQGGAVAVHMDLIAGNGGDTVNYGSASDLVSFVGKGGSITNVNVAATIGNFDVNTPIRSYNDIVHGQTVTDFVHANLLNELNPGSMDDSVGSEGAVVGAAGRLESQFVGYDSDNNPLYASSAAAEGVNGSLIDLTSTGIADAVAGNVQRIGAITAVQGLVLDGTGLVGVAKNVAAPYLTPAGTPVPNNPNGGPGSPELDGALGYGAIVAGSTPTVLVNGKLIPLVGPFVFTI